MQLTDMSDDSMLAKDDASLHIKDNSIIDSGASGAITENVEITSTYMMDVICLAQVNEDSLGLYRTL